MSKPKEMFKGGIIEVVDYDFDYVIISTSKGGMTISNPVFYEKEGVCTRLTSNFDFDKLLRKRIVDEECKEDEEFRMKLEDGSSIFISLLPEDYESPEAAFCELSDGTMVVFN